MVFGRCCIGRKHLGFLVRTFPSLGFVGCELSFSRFLSYFFFHLFSFIHFFFFFASSMAADLDARGGESEFVWVAVMENFLACRD